MSAAIDRATPAREQTIETTLLELVFAMSEVTSDEHEIVAAILDMLRNGRVRLRGSFRGSSLGSA
jgi:hypothetical protein